MTPVSKICAKARVEQFLDDFMQKEIYYFANSVAIVLIFLGLTQSKIIWNQKLIWQKSLQKVILTETKDNYNFVEM